MAFLKFKEKFSKKKATMADSLIDQKQEMIEGVSELEATTVKEIMVPRIDTLFIDVHSSSLELETIIKTNGFSRYPVYEETIDNVIGILYLKDVLKSFLDGKELDIRALVRKAYFVPESKKIDSLLLEFKRRRVHIAVAVDEYGGVSGIVCMEDVIEEIVGDIQDEFDNETEEVKELAPHVYLCDTRINIEELNEKTGLNLPFDDFDTLGGFVFDLFGKIPTKYEQIEWNHLEFIIQEMDNHKIKSVKIIQKEKGEENET